MQTISHDHDHNHEHKNNHNNDEDNDDDNGTERIHVWSKSAALDHC